MVFHVSEPSTSALSSSQAAAEKSFIFNRLKKKKNLFDQFVEREGSSRKLWRRQSHARYSPILDRGGRIHSWPRCFLWWECGRCDSSPLPVCSQWGIEAMVLRRDFLFFIALLSPQSVQYLSWNFFSCGSFSSVPSPMISSAFSFRIPLGLEFLSLPWLSISHFHFSIFWCFLYDISSSPWINSSINYSSLLFSLHIKVFLLPRAIFFITACSHLIISWSPCRGSLLSLPLQYITWH